jgi:acylphosphatase
MSKPNNVHMNITIVGRVQGVGFRFAAQKMAISLGIKGFVKNLHNGNLYVEAEGNDAQLGHFVDWCHKGPSHAYVDDVFIAKSDIKEFQYFDILY